MRDDDIVVGDVRVLHDAQAHLAGNLLRRHTLAVVLDDKRLDVVVRNVTGEANGEVRERARADPALGAVDNPAIRSLLRGGGQTAGDIRAVVRFSEREATHLLKLAQARQPFLLLCVRAQLVDKPNHELVVNAHERRERDVRASDLGVDEAAVET